jgi:ATP-dependent protease HslVU (ClpYQ) peptidase subunit
MVADSGAYDADSVVTGLKSKIWRAGDSLVGVAGNYRVMEIAKVSKIANPHELRDALLEDASTKSLTDFQIIVSNRRGVFYIGEDYGIVETKESYGAIGAGGLAALGALAALHQTDLPPKDIINLAIRSAEKHTIWARPPFKVESIIW